MSEKTIVEEIKDVIMNDEEVKEKWEDLTEVTSFSDFLKSFKLLYFFITKIVYIVEIIQSKFGKIDKEERIELAAEALDELVVFKGWGRMFEMIDGLVFKIMISQAVAAMDDKYGNGSWFNINEAIEAIDPSGVIMNLLESIFGSD